MSVTSSSTCLQGSSMPWHRKMVAVALAISSTVFADNTPVRIREGGSAYGTAVLSLDGNRVRQGSSSSGTILYAINGNQVREGTSPYGRVLATVQPDGRMTQGSGSYGRTIANVKEGQIREGGARYGKVIANTDGGRMSGTATAVDILSR